MWAFSWKEMLKQLLHLYSSSDFWWSFVALLYAPKYNRNMRIYCVNWHGLKKSKIAFHCFQITTWRWTTSAAIRASVLLPRVRNLFCAICLRTRRRTESFAFRPSFLLPIACQRSSLPWALFSTKSVNWSFSFTMKEKLTLPVAILVSQRLYLRPLLRIAFNFGI